MNKVAARRASKRKTPALGDLSDKLARNIASSC